MTIENDGPFLVKLGFTNVYGLATGDGLLVVDAGPDYEGAWEELKQGLGERGFTTADVRAVLVTHFHADHAGLARRWQEEGALVAVARGEEEMLAQGFSLWQRSAPYVRRLMLEHGVPEEEMAALLGRWSGPPKASEADLRPGERRALALGHRSRWRGPLHMTPVQPDRLLDDGERATFGRVTIQAIVCPGHTPYHSVFLWEEAGVLFSGDHILPKITPNPGLHFLSDGQRMKSLPAYLGSLQRLRELPVRRVLPAHEHEMGDLRRAVDRILRHHQRRSDKVLACLRERPHTAYELVPLLFPRVSRRQLWLTMAEAIGHLDLLEEEGLAAPQPADGRVVYQAV